jgi:NADPH2 dehydrogenase
MKMSDPIPQFSYIISYLATHYPSLSYIHLIEARAIGGGVDVVPLPGESLDFARRIWKKTGRPFLAAGGYTPENAQSHLSGQKNTNEDLTENELIVFGRWFISNVSPPWFRVHDGDPIDSRTWSKG